MRQREGPEVLWLWKKSARGGIEAPGAEQTILTQCCDNPFPMYPLNIDMRNKFRLH